MLRNDQLDAWDRENFFHPSTHLADFARGDLPDRIGTGGTGCHIVLSDECEPVSGGAVTLSVLRRRVRATRQERRPWSP